MLGSGACGRLGYETLALDGQAIEASATPRRDSGVADPDVDSPTIDAGGAQTPGAASPDEEVGGGGSSGNPSGGSEIDAQAAQGGQPASGEVDPAFGGAESGAESDAGSPTQPEPAGPGGNGGFVPDAGTAGSDSFGGSGGLAVDGGAGGFGGSTDETGGVAPSPTCGSTGTYLGISSFATDSEGWILETPPPLSGSMQWIGTDGSAALGALDVTTSLPNSSKQAYIKRRGAPMDLSGRVATASVLVVSATNIEMRVYALDANFVWADSGLVTLSLGTWTCVALDIDAPSLAVAGFDPTQIIEVGLEIGGSGDAHLRVDDIGY